MTQHPDLAALPAAGVSVWLDDLSRDRLASGNLPDLINTRSVVGVTTSPSIFQAALSHGRVSIEVDPRLAHDADKTVAQAVELWKIVDRPNLLIKIPAMEDGLPAISEAIGQGISVNVTLIFSVERHRLVMDAYLHAWSKLLKATQGQLDTASK